MTNRSLGRKAKPDKGIEMILIFDLVEDIHMDFNLGLKPLWETYYRDKCSFDEIKAYGEELFVHIRLRI